MKEKTIQYLLGAEQFVSNCIGHIPSHLIRNIAYRVLGMKIGKDTTVFGLCEIESARKVVIGNNTVIGHGAVLDGRGQLQIGDNVNLSSGVWIWTIQHDPDDPDFNAVKGKVVIEDYAWVSCRTTILPGVCIGKGAVIYAGSVVTKDVPPYAKMAGVPARQIGERNKDLRYKLKWKVPFI